MPMLPSLSYRVVGCQGHESFRGWFRVRVSDRPILYLYYEAILKVSSDHRDSRTVHITASQTPLQKRFAPVTQFAAHDFRRRCEWMLIDFVVIENMEHFNTARFQVIGNQ
jgi:hypothetical protein